MRYVAQESDPSLSKTGVFQIGRTIRQNFKLSKKCTVICYCPQPQTTLKEQESEPWMVMQESYRFGTHEMDVVVAVSGLLLHTHA